MEELNKTANSQVWNFSSSLASNNIWAEKRVISLLTQTQHFHGSMTPGTGPATESLCSTMPAVIKQKQGVCETIR